MKTILLRGARLVRPGVYRLGDCETTTRCEFCRVPFIGGRYGRQRTCGEPACMRALNAARCRAWYEANGERHRANVAARAGHAA